MAAATLSAKSPVGALPLALHSQEPAASQMVVAALKPAGTAVQVNVSPVGCPLSLTKGPAGQTDCISVRPWLEPRPAAAGAERSSTAAASSSSGARVWRDLGGMVVRLRRLRGGASAFVESFPLHRAPPCWPARAGARAACGCGLASGCSGAAWALTWLLGGVLVACVLP
jgi:hypothetical protein